MHDCPFFIGTPGFGAYTDEYRYPDGGAFGVIRPDQLENQVVVYAEPVDSSESLATYGLHTYVKVIGIGRDWHYIQAYEWYDVDKRISIPIDDAPKGFVHSQNVTEYANFGGVVLDAYPERGTVCLYARPDENAELIGTYYSGAYGIRLFPVESTLAYTLIRIGDTVGYALTGMTTNGNYLFGSEPPPLPTGVLKTSASLLCEPDGQSESLVSLESGQEVTLYGFHRGWYHVLAIDAQSNRVLGYVSMDVVDVSP